MRLRDILESPSLNWLEKFIGSSGGKSTSCQGVYWHGYGLAVGRWIPPRLRGVKRQEALEAKGEQKASATD